MGEGNPSDVENGALSIQEDESNEFSHDCFGRTLISRSPTRDRLDTLTELDQAKYLRQLYLLMTMLWCVIASMIAGCLSIPFLQEILPELDNFSDVALRVCQGVIQVLLTTLTSCVSPSLPIQQVNIGLKTLTVLVCGLVCGLIIGLVSVVLKSMIFVMSAVSILAIISFCMLLFSMQSVYKLTTNGTILLQWTLTIISYGLLSMYYTWEDSFFIISTALLMVANLTFRNSYFVKLFLVIARGVL